MDKRILILILSLIFLVLTLSLYNLFVQTTNSSRIGYVNLNRIYTSLNYTLEVKNTLENMEREKRSSLDSIRQRLFMTDSLTDPSTFQTLKLEYETSSSRFQQELMQYANFYDEQIWTRINERLKEYGKRNHFSILLGSKGDGNIMYGDTLLEETDRVIVYINQSSEKK